MKQKQNDRVQWKMHSNSSKDVSTEQKGNNRLITADSEKKEKKNSSRGVYLKHSTISFA